MVAKTASILQAGLAAMSIVFMCQNQAVAAELSSFSSGSSTSEFMTLNDSDGNEITFKFAEENDDLRVVNESGEDLGLKVVFHSQGNAPTLEPREVSDPVLDNGSDVPDSGLSLFNTNGVDVPPGYVYDPSRGSLHDYCTFSPDQLGGADFRGACARHDLCYEEVNRGVGSHHECNLRFRNDLGTVCDGQGAGRGACNAAADVYFRAVEAKNP